MLTVYTHPAHIHSHIHKTHVVTKWLSAPYYVVGADYNTTDLRSVLNQLRQFIALHTKSNIEAAQVDSTFVACRICRQTGTNSAELGSDGQLLDVEWGCYWSGSSTSKWRVRRLTWQEWLEWNANSTMRAIVVCTEPMNRRRCNGGE